jgi:tripeptidyl-peptidase-1
MLCPISPSTLLGLLAVVGIAAASPLNSRSTYAVKDSHRVPRQWKEVGAAPASHVIHLQVGLKPSQFDELERHLYEGEYLETCVYIPYMHSC